MELDDGHGEGDWHKRDDQVLYLGKEEREKQKTRRSKQRYKISFYFGIKTL